MLPTDVKYTEDPSKEYARVKSQESRNVNNELKVNNIYRFPNILN
jgi:hypothetical protein